MGKNGMNFLVGIVVLIAAAVLVFGVNFLKNTSPTEKTHRFHVLFEKVATLQLGDPVKLNGVTMGRVKVIELNGHLVRVSIDLRQSFKNQDGEQVPIRIPVNSTIRVQNIGLMGERQIEIHLGDSKEYYQPGQTILSGQFDAGIAEVMGIAGKVFEDAEDLVSEMRQIMDSTVGDSQFVRSFRKVVGNTEKLSDQVDGLVDTLQPKLLSSAKLLSETAAEVHQLVSEQKKPISEIVQNGQEISARVNGLTLEIDSIAKEMKSMLTQINSSKGTLGGMIRDTVFYRDLRATMQNADSLFGLIRKQGLDVNVDLF